MDDAERAHQLLTIAAEPPGPPVLPLGLDLVRRARRRRRLRQQGAVAMAVLTTAAVATPLAVIHGRSGPVRLAERSEPPRLRAPSTLPREFGAAAPVLGPVRGVAGPMQQPYCRAADVVGSAELLASPYGALGIVRLRGDKCSLEVDPGSITLLDSAGRPLAVPVRDEANRNPGRVIRPDVAQAAGEVTVGFAWRGSWCGSPADRLRLVAVAKPARARTVVTVPLKGRSPACAEPGRAPGYLVPGLVGRPDSPVQPPPPAWAALRATVELPRTAGGDEPVSYHVVLQNTGDRPVTLSPCPDYSTLIAGSVLASSHGAAGGLVATEGGKLPCGRVLPPGGSLQVVLASSYGPYAKGVVHIEWAMAGVPTATGQVRIR